MQRIGGNILGCSPAAGHACSHPGLGFLQYVGRRRHTSPCPPRLQLAEQAEQGATKSSYLFKYRGHATASLWAPTWELRCALSYPPFRVAMPGAISAPPLPLTGI